LTQRKDGERHKSNGEKTGCHLWAVGVSVLVQGISDQSQRRTTSRSLEQNLFV